MPADPDRVESIFARARAVPAADRAALVAAACGDDPELRQRVERLLAADADLEAAPDPDATGTIDPDPDDTGTADAPDPAGAGPATPRAADPGPAAGTLLGGRYKLVEPIGEGGMGAVWVARQTEPVKRVVAVKLVRAGMDSRAVLLRFEAERQALALMDHPNIARVLDAGATPDGRPYFVMELVKGVPITQFCDDRRLTPRERLELFVPVCQAVQHAHQKGVIHRDMKPSNVLVALYDGRPVPKVIDFGVAKAAGPPLTDQTLMTGYGAVVGTPEYMSPEQASFNQLDVDTRSDVYALGVLLYELLTGVTPVDRKSLGKAALLEVLRVVREVEAPRPSAKLSTLDALPSIAANRGTEPAKLSRLLRGELDWVLLKALEKDRGRRYESAAGFAADIGRYLAGEPVQAVPPSAGYRLRTFARRNRGPVAAAGLVLLALLAGVTGTTLGMLEARRQADRAETNALRADLHARASDTLAVMANNAARAAEASGAQARQEAARAAAVNRFLLKDLLDQADPKHNPVGDKVTVRELVDRAAAAADRDPAALADPAVGGAVRHTLGRVYLRLLVFDPAEAQLRRAVDALRAAHGPTDPRTLDAVGDLSLALRDLLRPADAEAVLTEYLALARPALGPTADPVLMLENNLGLVLKDRGDYPAAERLFRRAWDHYRDAPQADQEARCYAAANLAWCLRHQPEVAKVREGYDLYRRILPDCRDVFGPRNPVLFDVVDDFGQAARQVGRPAEAERLHREAWAGRAAAFGPAHPQTLASAHHLGRAVRDADPAAAEGLFRQVLAADPPPGAPGERFRAIARTDLALALASQGKLAEADREMDAAFPAVRRLFGLDYPDALQAAHYRLQVLFAVERWADAEGLLAEVLPVLVGRFGAESAAAVDARRRLGEARLRQGKWAAAEADLRAALAVYDREQPAHWTTADTRSLLGGAVLGQGKAAEAEPLLLTGYDELKARARAIPPLYRFKLAEAADRLVELAGRTSDRGKLARWRAERARYPFVAPPPRPAN